MPHRRAKAALAALLLALTSTALTAAAGEPGASPTLSAAVAGRTEITLAMGFIGGPPPTTSTPGSSFRDCNDCPEMVVVPPGNFIMGANPEEEGHENVPRRDRGRAAPQHAVTIGSVFAVSRYEINRIEFARFVAATSRQVTGCWTTVNQEWKLFADRSWRSPGFPQNDRDPVVCVSWEDAKAYAAWLGKETHQRYRLLSEAEWEYVARAGTTTPRPWGIDIGRNYSACIGCGSQWDNLRPAPAGTFTSNRFGLDDLLGNVSEWVEDCWHPTYQGAPAAGQAWVDPSCEFRTFRGGSWQSPAMTVRSAFRDRDLPTVRTTAIGFRIARSPTP